jgi:hypothetical protein
MLIFLTLLACGAVNCLILEALQKRRSIWYALPLAGLAVALGLYALVGQTAESYVIEGIDPFYTTVEIGLVIGLDMLTIGAISVCIAQDKLFSEIPAFFTYSHFIAFLLTIVGAMSYAMASAAFV